MLHDCCATHDLWIIWNAECDSDIQFWIWPENRPRSGKRGQISKSKIFIKICLFFQFCLSIPNMPFILTCDNSKCQEICFKVTRYFLPDIISYILWFDHTFDLTSPLIRIKKFVGKVDIFRGINLIFFIQSDILLLNIHQQKPAPWRGYKLSTTWRRRGSRDPFPFILAPKDRRLLGGL